jgi:hypothetical protein
MRSVVLLSGWLALTMTACTEEGWKETQAFTIIAPPEDCDEPGGCPTNSPIVDTYPFHDLSTRRGEKNKQEIAIEKFMVGGSEYDFTVEHGRILATRNGTIFVDGPDLEGGRLWLRRDAATYIVEIVDVVPVKMWARLNSRQPRPEIEVYELKWIPGDRGELPPPHLPPWKNICDDAMLPADSIELDLPAAPGAPDGSTWSSAPSAPSETYIPNSVTFVFEGDRIDAVTKQVYDFDKAWINLGCAGHLLSKMHLMGHVAATASMGYVTTRLERTAIMKMFAADYCGGGRPFTVPGVPLQWHDHRDWLKYSPPQANYAVEARWTARGASCLSVPRADAQPTDDSRAEFPDGVGVAITQECPVSPPPCSNQNNQDFAGAHLITVSP